MRILVLSIILLASMVCSAKNITISANNAPASTVFRSIVEQTGKNFIYSSALLNNMRITINIKNQSLKNALHILFKDTDIEYEIKGNNIILKQKFTTQVNKPTEHINTPKLKSPNCTIPELQILDEVIVVSSLERPTIETAEIGAKKLTAEDINNSPVLLGESDVIKALQMQPGISDGQEGIAGMNVHGGNVDENLYMLDNVPLYQVNHFAGLFSAFNVENIRFIDFFKSSIPAKYDGRLSSYLDVHTKNGSKDGHHGKLRLGLTSGSININGPIRQNTTYTVALRRSWFEVLSVPILSIINAQNDDEHKRFNYSFMDFNGKIAHQFNHKTSGFLSFYFGNDILKTGLNDKNSTYNEWSENEKFDMHWGNIVTQAGLNSNFNDNLLAEFTIAYNRYFSNMKHLYQTIEQNSNDIIDSKAVTKTKNSINDYILRADFKWNTGNNNKVTFGCGYTLHSFLPAKTDYNYSIGTAITQSYDSIHSYTANEANIYIEDDLQINNRYLLNIGIHSTLFNIDNHTHVKFGPRISTNYRVSSNSSIKFSYSRTNQFVHQLSQSYLSLPTDQWIPISGNFKPLFADKYSFGTYWLSNNRTFEFSIEGYWKYMRNLIDYKDEYYLQQPNEVWNDKLCSGNGTAKGIDFKIEKVIGKFRGHIAYSLSWTDRNFPDKNNGISFPARFDNRHYVNILLNWNINNKIKFNMAWIGHSGNRVTIFKQVWESPDFNNQYGEKEIPLKSNINNYQLPFYHRLDISCNIYNKGGYWNFSLFNAYCHLNTIGIRRTYTNNNIPTFQKIRLLPIIPSVSYTWQF